VSITQTVVHSQHPGASSQPYTVRFSLCPAHLTAQSVGGKPVQMHGSDPLATCEYMSLTGYQPLVTAGGRWRPIDPFRLAMQPKIAQCAATIRRYWPQGLLRGARRCAVQSESGRPAGVHDVGFGCR